MRLALIACAVMQREISFELVQTDSIMRVWWMKQGLHDTPDLLRQQLQKQIDQIEEENEDAAPDKKYDAVCLGYGLCSNGVIGLRSDTLPLVIPRCDDCMSLFLGSAQRYRTLFAQHPGTYWYNPGWIEHAFTPSEASYAARYTEYVEKYGEDNADFLMEESKSWVKNYNHCTYIDSPVYHNEAYVQYAKQAAAQYHWDYDCEKGDQRMLHALICGSWQENDFLVCPPEHIVEADYSDRKIRAVPV